MPEPRPSSAAKRIRRAEERIRASYERVPYACVAQRQTHPDRLATLGILHGLEPASPEACRVLEVGAADGSNLLPMAHALPGSTFLGIDLSPRQIAAGRRRVEELGLDNLELRTLSLREIDESFGGFDYVLAHGVFSWVPRETQEEILALCRARLKPHGIAYVSYNALPGWRLLGLVRDMMLYRTRGVADPDVRLARAVEWLDLLHDAMRDHQDAHSLVLREAREHLAKFHELRSYVLHDYLEDSNDPLYFHQFIERASRHGLAYLAEADCATGIRQLPPALAQQIEALAGDRLDLEQYVDFATNRSFRRTLLCHRELEVSCEMVPDRLRRLHAAAAVEPVEPAAGSAPGASFRTARGRTFSTAHPLARAVLLALGEAWPQTIAFDELLAAVERRTDAAPDGDAAVVMADVLHSSYFADVVELHPRPLRCTPEAGEKPRALALARWQAQNRLPIVDERHRLIAVDEVGRILLLHLDGETGRRELLAVVEREVREGRLEVERDGEPTRRPEVLAELIEFHLGKMAEHGLLVA